ncbi:hypothetical protein M3Y94_00361700 [Aphelenchoides besseyi]|nr:hypothetical protein M3Y94_00361700 [Aphelenchoides besseyi]KAI6235256.1 Phosphatidylinositol 4-kinase type 2 [Aphelenchoides besseyi]
MSSFHTETDLSDSDETRPLVPREKRGDHSNMSGGSMSSAASSDLDDTGVVDKYCSHMPDEYRRTVSRALKFIDKNPPTLISSGSSGSYFIHDSDNKIIGVFKPEDEEPYGINNPKWGKWFQKVLFPCSFGRGCLVPNQGYVSEAAAWIVDEFFGLHVVPPTAVILMASKVFSYSRFQRYEARTKQRVAGRFPNLHNRFNWSQTYKKKKGSFQTFVHDFMSPEDFARLYPVDSLSETEREYLTAEIQKMFVLDYITRNTDRLNANFLMKVIEPEIEVGMMAPDRELESMSISVSMPTTETAQSLESHDTDATTTTIIENMDAISESEAQTVHATAEIGPLKRADRRFEIACIDNGLAFPFQHPSGIRTYPFSWSKYFPYFANQPFLPEIKQRVLNILQDISAIKQLCESIRAQLSADKRYQKQKTIESQLSVVRGQMYNLLKALEGNLTPAHLEMQTPVYANELKKKQKRRAARNRRLNSDEVCIPIDSDDESENQNVPRSTAMDLWRSNYAIKKHTRNPYFSCC